MKTEAVIFLFCFLCLSWKTLPQNFTPVCKQGHDKAAFIIFLPRLTDVGQQLRWSGDTLQVYWPLIGQYWSRDLNTGLWLVRTQFCKLESAELNFVSFSRLLNVKTNAPWDSLHQQSRHVSMASYWSTQASDWSPNFMLAVTNETVIKWRLSSFDLGFYGCTFQLFFLIKHPIYTHVTSVNVSDIQTWHFYEVRKLLMRTEKWSNLWAMLTLKQKFEKFDVKRFDSSLSILGNYLWVYEI